MTDSLKRLSSLACGKIEANKTAILPNQKSGMTYVVDRAYNDYSWYYSLQQQGSVFVGRMKSNARYQVIEELSAQGEGVVSDELIRLSSIKPKRIARLQDTDTKELM